MMSDHRQVRFPPAALAIAIGASPAAAASLGLPPLKPQAVRLHQDAGKVDVVFQTGGGARSVTIEILPLAALLLSFCFRASIPLPRQARKAVRIEGGTLVLDFSMEFEPELATLRPETVNIASGGAKSLDWGRGSQRV